MMIMMLCDVSKVFSLALVRFVLFVPTEILWDIKMREQRSELGTMKGHIGMLQVGQETAATSLL